MGRAQHDVSESGEQTISRVSGVRIHAHGGIGVALLATIILVASVVVAPIFLRSAGLGAGALSQASDPSGSPSVSPQASPASVAPSVSPQASAPSVAPSVLPQASAPSGAPAVSAATRAQQMADRMVTLWSGGDSVAVAAAYVETTCGKYGCTFPDGLPGVSASDAVLVVEVEGWFPHAHRAARPGDGATTSLIQAYDLTAGIDEPGMWYLFDPASPDMPGASASPAQRFRELRQFGVPTMLLVNSTSATASP